jgi:hypothetical protein
MFGLGEGAITAAEGQIGWGEKGQVAGAGDVSWASRGSADDSLRLSLINTYEQWLRSGTMLGRSLSMVDLRNRSWNCVIGSEIRTWLISVFSSMMVKERVGPAILVLSV